MAATSDDAALTPAVYAEVAVERTVASLLYIRSPGQVVRLIVDEFGKLLREGAGDAELAGAQAYMTGSFPLTIETPGDIARQVVNVVFYDLSVDELRTYRQRANAVTPDDILRVARTYLQPDRLAIVMVGNAAAFKDQLAKVGFGQYELISLADLDLSSAGLRKP